jgi:hypothetical protein
MPEQGVRRASRADSSDIDSKPVGMERVEFIGEAADADGR